MFDTWIVITGACAAIACAVPGTFLVLRRLSLMGDAISHAVLPGLALGFLWTGSRSHPALFLGAAVTGVLTAVFSQWIARFGNVDRGAAMGIVFTSLFASGLLLIVQAADHVDLDPACVLYGAIELTPLDTLSVGSWEVPRAALVLGAVAGGNVLLVCVLFKEFRLGAFDPGLADTLGFPSRFLHHLLMAMVAVTTVAAFEAVGSIIVIGFLVVPVATGMFWTRRLVPLLVLASGFGVAAVVLGHLGATALPALGLLPATTSSGMMAVAGGILFALSWLFGPADGYMAKRLSLVPTRIRLPDDDA